MMEGQKRSQDDGSSGNLSKRLKKEDLRTVCQYGVNCYRRSPYHFEEFKHPELEALFLQSQKIGKTDFARVEVEEPFLDPPVVRQQLQILNDINILQLISDDNTSTQVTQPSTSGLLPSFKSDQLPNSKPHEDNVSSPALASKKPYIDSSNVLQKWNQSCPFNFFLTRLPSEPSVPRSISFKELFHPSLGEVRSLCHFNFMVDIEWFLEETLDGVDTTIVYGVETAELESAAKVFPWLKVYLVKSPFPFGHHHTKMTLIEYTDSSMRFIVSTANLIESDWANRTQGVWVSPRCPKSSESKVPDGPGSFRSDLIQYLQTYPPKCTASWVKSIQSIDTSQIRVVFVASAPHTSQSSSNGFQWGESKMEKVLKTFPVPNEVDPNWPLVIQCSSIATLGQSDDWVRGELGRCLMGENYGPSTPIRIIYPSDGNVRGSLEGINGGGCLPYFKSTHIKQLWIRKHFYLWKSDSVERTRAMPHIKTYSRISPDNSKLGYFLLTSGNLSKAAWGKFNKNRDRLTVMSWEAGVLFLPSLFDFSESFPISKTAKRNPDEFFLPFDVPLTKYLQNDEPWSMETLMEFRQNS